MRTKTHRWLHGLIGAFISGGASAVASIIIAPESFNLREGLLKLIQLYITAGVVGTCLYLKQSPLPEEDTVVLIKKG
jgi:hypothetical protein